MNKVQLIGNTDSSLLISNGDSSLATSSDLTTVNVFDIVSYLPGFASQFYFSAQFKDYESLE